MTGRPERMPRRSSILALPDDLRDALNARLVKTGFRDYAELAEWLNEALDARELELRVSKSALHRHGQQFEEKLDKLRLATEQAKALAEGAEDDEGAMGDALVRLVQEKLFTVLMDMEVDPSKVQLGSLLKGVAQLTRSGIATKKFMREARDRTEQRLAALERETTGDGQPKFDPATLRRVREEIYGIYE